MIGSGLKKFALENGMQVSNGVGYGSLCGYAATLTEGSGYKQIVFSTVFPEQAQKDAFLTAVNGVDVQRQYRVQKFDIMPRTIQVVFQDNPGTMKKIAAFVDWIAPLLQQHGATKASVCAECGTQISAGCWKLVDGVAYHYHETCAEKVRNEVVADNENRQIEAEGSYALGAVGALGGAAIGAVVWAIVLNMGYVASVVGFVIGWLAEKGYNLLRGKQGKGKIAILIVAILLGVLVGTISVDVYYLVTIIGEGETYLTYGDIPEFLLQLFMEDAEYRGATLGNIGMGLLFAALGVVALLRKAGKEVADTKFIDLK